MFAVAEHLFIQKAGSRDFPSPVLSSRDGREDGYSVSVLGNSFQVRMNAIEKYDFRRVAADAESIKDIADTGSVFYFDKARFGPSVGLL